jgi:hypothetical protein
MILRAYLSANHPIDSRQKIEQANTKPTQQKTHRTGAGRDGSGAHTL